MKKLNCFNIEFYDKETEKAFHEKMNNQFQELFSEVNVTYNINYAIARSVINEGGAYDKILHKTLEIVQKGEMIKSSYRDYHASAWIKIQHDEKGGSFVKLMNEFKRLKKAFDGEDGTSWNIVFYTKLNAMGMN